MIGPFHTCHAAGHDGIEHELMLSQGALSRSKVYWTLVAVYYTLPAHHFVFFPRVRRLDASRP